MKLSNKQSSQNHRLLRRYEKLDPTRRYLCELTSILYRGFSIEDVFRCAQRAGTRFPEIKIKNLPHTKNHLNRLQDLGLLDKRFHCREVIREVIARRAVVQSPFWDRERGFDLIDFLTALYGSEKDGQVKNGNSQKQYLRYLDPMLGQTFMWGTWSSYQERIKHQRNMRIGILFDIPEVVKANFEFLAEHLYGYDSIGKICSEICFNPFDKEWFGKTPLEIQCAALYYEINRKLFSPALSEEFMEYACDPTFQRLLPASLAVRILPCVLVRLILQGDFTKAQDILARLAPITDTRAMEAVMLLLRGQTDIALHWLEKVLVPRKTRDWKDHLAVFWIAGLFHVLALLISVRSKPIIDVERYISRLLKNDALPREVGNSLQILKFIVESHYRDIEGAWDFITVGVREQDVLVNIFSNLALYWFEGKLDSQRISALSDLFISTKRVGLRWMALEYAELLCLVELDTPVRRNYINHTQNVTGMVSVIRRFPIKEPWRRKLQALAMVTSDRLQAGMPERRLVWFVCYEDGELLLEPREQKRTQKGGWTKGRAISLKKIYSSEDLDYLTEQDEKLRSALVKRSHSGPHYYASTPSYTLEDKRALLAIVGHPRVFLANAPTVPVEFVRGEPQIVVETEGESWRIRIDPYPHDDPIMLLQETPTRFKVVQFLKTHKRIAEILGPEGLKVPQSGEKEIAEAVSGLSSLVTIHSAVEGIGAKVEQVTPDATPVMHLLPAGSGFRMEIFVKPLGFEGPYLKPGEGVANVIAKVNGRRLMTTRDLDREKLLAAEVAEACAEFIGREEGDRCWFLDSPEICLDVLLKLKSLQEQKRVVVAWPEGEKLRVRKELSFDALKVKVRSRGDWFDLNGKLVVDENLVLDLKTVLEQFRRKHKRFIPIGEDQFIALTRQLRRKLEDLDAFSQKRGKDLRLHPLAAMTLEDLARVAGQFDADNHWKERLEAIREMENYSPTPPPTLNAQLRDYQVEGYRWLARLARLGMGACLADDMGLGKTIQALALLLDRASGGPALVVAPTSVCMNWIDEAARFAPTLNIKLFGGNNRAGMVENLKEMDVLVCSYGLLNQEAELLASREWNTIVLDEAQAIKNFNTKRCRAAMALQGRFRMITTGTPIENHLGEFYTLFNFINPGLLGSRQRFNERFAAPIERDHDRDARRHLKRLVQPFILRRTKNQVLEELPERTEVILKVELSTKERAFYEALRRQALERLEQGTVGDDPIHMKILMEIMRLRQACCHPRLIHPESRISSSKMALFGQVVGEILENRHKALVFSQFVKHLDLVRAYLDERNIPYRYLDGSTRAPVRRREVEAFQAGSGDLFLISLKAGGLGLNLTAADYVILLDPWWNPAVEDQASDRAYRIGQTRPVTVYRLVASNTIEEKIVKLHQEKRDLANSLLEGSDMTGKMSTDELLELIRGV